MTQSACQGWSTQSAALGPLAQYSDPVALSTARPDGDVVHEVKYGQTLWSIAIEQIKRLNNLKEDTLIQGWKLLIKKGATQPAPVTASVSVTDVVTREFSLPTTRPTTTPSALAIVPAIDVGGLVKQNSIVVVALLVSFSVLVAGIAGFGKKRS